MIDFYKSIKEKFPYLPDDKLTQVLSIGELVMLDEGEIFVKIGERTSKAAFILEGLMRNYIIDENGEEVTVLFAAEMQTITPYKTIYLNSLSTETTAAVERTVLLVTDFKAFKDLALSDLDIMRLYSDILETSLVGAIHRIEDFTQKSPEQRYERILKDESFLIDRAPLKYLASYLGITPVSLSRIRKRLSQKKG